MILSLLILSLSAAALGYSAYVLRSAARAGQLRPGGEVSYAGVTLLLSATRRTAVAPSDLAATTIVN